VFALASSGIVVRETCFVLCTFQVNSDHFVYKRGGVYEVISHHIARTPPQAVDVHVGLYHVCHAVSEPPHSDPGTQHHVPYFRREMGHEAPNSRASTGVDPGLVGHELPQNGLRVGVGPLL